MALGLTMFLLLLVCVPEILGQEISPVNIVVDGSSAIAETDQFYICATIDWWPNDFCRYDCAWVNSSVITMDLYNPLLVKTVQAFKHLRLRIGGSPQDQVIYNVGNPKYPCHPFQSVKEGLFTLSEGCLYMGRWDELNQFFNKTGAIVTFGLNALYGRQKLNNNGTNNNVWIGDWDPSNTEALMNYTISKGYQIDSWEFGNELSGTGIGASVGSEQYAKDLIRLKQIMNDSYRKSYFKPKLVAPGGFFDQNWYTNLLRVLGSGALDILSHHIYNLGPGNEPKLITSRILDPSYLSSSITGTYRNIEQMIQQEGPWASIWVGESGGAYGGGAFGVSDRFIDNFWYLDQLGMAAKYKTKVYCRQSLLGGDYALLNRTTLEPNPDYYSALLWHRLMGTSVLEVDTNASSYLRSYAHCSKERAGVTLLLINLSNQTKLIINVHNQANISLQANEKSSEGKHSSRDSYCKEKVKEASDGPSIREEYLLTPKDGDIHSQTMVLNGNILKVTDQGDIPTLDPVLKDMNSPIYISPLSIAFIVIPDFDAPACA